MDRKIRYIRAAVLTLACICLLLAFLPAQAATYRQGSQGETVRTIQTKLKRWGYYSGSVDGVYGAKTLAALGISSSGGSSTSTSASRNDDFTLLCRMISAEARGEPYTGQVAVGAVILNRVDHPSFPNTVAGVLFQPGAFSPVADGQFYKVTITDSARRAAQDALNGWDPTGGAIYFYNPAKSTSKWIFSRPVVLTIGEHVFAK